MPIEIPIVFVRETMGDVLTRADDLSKDIERLNQFQSQPQLPKFQAAPQAEGGGFLNTLAQAGILAAGTFGRRGLGALRSQYQTGTYGVASQPFRLSKARTLVSRKSNPYGRFDAINLSSRYEGPKRIARPAHADRAGQYQNIGADFLSKKSYEQFFKKQPSQHDERLIDEFLNEGTESLNSKIETQIFKPEHTQ